MADARSPYAQILAICLAPAVPAIEQRLTELLQPRHPELVFTGSFTLALSPDGTGAATHYLCQSPLHEDDTDVLFAELPSFVDVCWVWWAPAPEHDDPACVRIEAPADAALVAPSLQRWTIDAALEALGLQRLQRSPWG